MQQFFDVFIDFVRQGIGAIFRFVAAIWSWAATQVGNLFRLPWQDWPMWRVLLLAALLFGLGWYLYKALWELWEAWKKTLAALAGMMAVLIKTLPQILLAGLIALAGVWILSNLDFSDLRPSFLHTGQPAPE
ncbi:MAG TPA: hypothetical protein VFY92_01225 [Hyphomicrobiaceae bacterium]|nr:hypothetical protein [Hyphomicrobiaceae bacterium]